MAEVAPAMGMIGTLIGLVKMFPAMPDPTAIGAAMAVALLATLYGAIIANLVAMPIAVRLRRRRGPKQRSAPGWTRRWSRSPICEPRGAVVAVAAA